MIKRVIDGFRFLNDMTQAERVLAADGDKKLRKEAAELIAAVQKS